jgi:hypothetical protein
MFYVTTSTAPQHQQLVHELYCSQVGIGHDEISLHSSTVMRINTGARHFVQQQG